MNASLSIIESFQEVVLVECCKDINENWMQQFGWDRKRIIGLLRNRIHQPNGNRLPHISVHALLMSTKALLKFEIKINAGEQRFTACLLKMASIAKTLSNKVYLPSLTISCEFKENHMVSVDFLLFQIILEWPGQRSSQLDPIEWWHSQSCCQSAWNADFRSDRLPGRNSNGEMDVWDIHVLTGNKCESGAVFIKNLKCKLRANNTLRSLNSFRKIRNP